VKITKALLLNQKQSYKCPTHMLARRGHTTKFKKLPCHIDFTIAVAVDSSREYDRHASFKELLLDNILKY